VRVSVHACVRDCVCTLARVFECATVSMFGKSLCSTTKWVKMVFKACHVSHSKTGGRYLVKFCMMHDA